MSLCQHASCALKGPQRESCAGEFGAGQAQRLAALQLIRGDVKGALEAVIAADCLSADFVSLAAQAGRAAWVAATKAYAARLEMQGLLSSVAMSQLHAHAFTNDAFSVRISIV